MTPTLDSTRAARWAQVQMWWESLTPEEKQAARESGRGFDPNADTFGRETAAPAAPQGALAKRLAAVRS